MAFLRILEYTRFLMKDRVKPGDIVVDATCGNGNDTSFLASLVGERGKVYGFDIQDEALKNTEEKLKEEDLADRVTLIKDNHGNLKHWVNEKVKGAMFNLGYLPGSNKEITTKPDTTMKAIDSLLELLEVNGIITIVVYRKHDQSYEARHIEKYLEALDQKKYAVLQYSFVNQMNEPPFLIAIEKK